MRMMLDCLLRRRQRKRNPLPSNSRNCPMSMLDCMEAKEAKQHGVVNKAQWICCYLSHISQHQHRPLLLFLSSRVNLMQTDHRSSPSRVNQTQTDHRSSPSRVNQTQTDHRSSPSRVNLTQTDHRSSPSRVNLTQTDHRSSPSRVKLIIGVVSVELT